MPRGNRFSGSNGYNIDDYVYGGGSGVTREQAQVAMQRGEDPDSFNNRVSGGQWKPSRTAKKKSGNKGK